MRSIAVVVGGVAAAMWTAACADENVLSKGPEHDPLMRAPATAVPHGLRLGRSQVAALGETAQVHAFHFVLSAPAIVDLATRATKDGDDVDTVLYLYRPEGNDWGMPLAKADDVSQRIRFSVLTGLELEAGRYRVVVKGYHRQTRGPFRLESSCSGDGCRRASVPTPRCLFGTRYHAFLRQHRFDTVSAHRFGSVDDLTPMQRAQLVVATQEVFDDVSVAADALWRADDGVVELTQRRLRSTGTSYVGFELSADGVVFGGIFPAGDPISAALVDDGVLYQCAVDAGSGAAAGDDCNDTEPCREGLRCAGISRYSDRGRCVVDDVFAGAGNNCTDDTDCGEHLVCAGAEQCTPYWTRGSFQADNREDIPDGGTLRATFDVRGLSDVAADVKTNVIIFHDRPADVQVSLASPSGATVVLFDGSQDATRASGPLHLNVPVRGLGAFGAVNGPWTLLVRDTAAERTGDLRNAVLTITSRDAGSVRRVRLR